MSNQLIFSLALLALASIAVDAGNNGFRQLLPTVTPSSYRITFEPDLTNFNYSGSEIINITIGNQNTNQIVLKARALLIRDASISTDGGSSWTNADYIDITNNYILTLTFPLNLQANTQALLKIRFYGILHGSKKGFFKVKYPGGKYAAATHFEPYYVRRAFPCWDEPAIKTTFQITLIAPTDKVCLSNTPVQSETSRNDGKKEVLFQVTPLISTYLVVFVVGDFEYLESADKNGKPLRVYTPPGEKDSGQYVLQTAVTTLNYYYIPYPLPKLDLISINQFEKGYYHGAMENCTGKIIYLSTITLLRLVSNVSISLSLMKFLINGLETWQRLNGGQTLVRLKKGFSNFIEKFTTDALFSDQFSI